jgi:hypothetical protein
MFDNINKSDISFEKYVELKTDSLTESYVKRFKWIDKFLYWLSWFGNGVSVFLAFFFIQSLFFSSFMEVGNSVFVTLGIIFFLTMFELLKRYIFGMFSKEYIKSKFHVFRKNMIGFIAGVLILVCGSFYFTLNGAMKFTDNKATFTEKTETTISAQTDSLNTFYFSHYIKPLMDDNKILTDQNTSYTQQVTQATYKTKYMGLIEANNKKIESNKTQIANYEKRRDDEIAKLNDTQNKKLNESLDTNKSNVIAFLILSTLIEFIIMLGVYFDKFYRFKVTEEYEKTVVETPEFKNWYKFNEMLRVIYARVKEVGDPIPTSAELTDLFDVGGSKIDKKSFDKFIKLLYYLDIVKLDGRRRVLNMKEEDGIKKLRNYFNIN